MVGRQTMAIAKPSTHFYRFTDIAVAQLKLLNSTVLYLDRACTYSTLNGADNLDNQRARSAVIDVCLAKYVTIALGFS